MRFERTRARSRRRPSMTALVDVVFLLLVFFLLAGTLRSIEPFEVALPESPSAGPAEPRHQVVWLDAEGRLALGGERLELDPLAARLRALQRPPSVQLRADARARARDLLPLLEALDAAGVREVDLVVRASS